MHPDEGQNGAVDVALPRSEARALLVVTASA
jgi:hypothetical protein